MHRIKITVTAFALMLMMLTFQCYAKDISDVRVRVRIRAPRESNTQASLKGYSNIVLYDNEGIEPVEIMETDNRLTVAIGSDGRTVIVRDNSGTEVYSYKSGESISFGSENDDENCTMIEIDGKAYRGYMSFYISDGRLISVNHVDLEQYLYGVVPGEIPSDWNIEAVKSQAVAARTYAAFYMGAGGEYDLEDSGSSQVYGGYDSETAAGNKAVDDTSGEVIYYDGKPINAVFHSTSGGYTEDSENVWNDALPYLRGVKDEYSNVSPVTQWEKKVTSSYIVGRLNADGKSANRLNSIEITSVSGNNRVVECIFRTDKGDYTYKKDAIRSLIGYDVLMSTWFTINGSSGSTTVYFADQHYAKAAGKNDGILGIITEGNADEGKLTSGSLKGSYVISASGKSELDNDKAAGISASGVTALSSGGTVSSSSEYVFTGRGWGHGVGLSQYGAKKMAEEGYDYMEILKHYYTGVDIR